MISTPYIFREIYDIFFKAPLYTIYMELLLVLSVIWFVLYKRKSYKKRLTPEEKESILNNWQPEPLVANVPQDHRALHPKMITGAVGKRITVDGIDCLNMGSHNYLGLLEDQKIRADAITSLKKYGVGSCGPRGFYGTVDVHLELEERIAKFMEMEEAVVYSYGFSTIASAIPAYCKRGDLVFVDECVHFAIQKGLDASRSTIFYFKHNDVKDLKRLLENQRVKDEKNPKKAGKIRRFLIAEGIYMNTGEMCPLPQLIELRKEYKLRFLLDESISFGTIGDHGRGVTEYFKVERHEVDLICSTLEYSVGSIGGFCVGATFIVDHQRLSGLGYCFSASAPPLLTQAAISAIDRFENEPKIFKELNDVSEKVHNKFEKLSFMTISGHILSPIKHLYIKENNNSIERTVEQNMIYKIVDTCIENGLAIINAEYLETIEKQCPRPSIRIAVNRLLTDADLNFAFNTLEEISKQILLVK